MVFSCNGLKALRQILFTKALKRIKYLRINTKRYEDFYIENYKTFLEEIF
jgi:hypothetical protein